MISRFARPLLVSAVAVMILAASSAGASPFRKGTSLQAFTFPAVVGDGYADDPFPSRAGAETFFATARLAAAGFDHVRLPVDIGPFLDDPGERRWKVFRGYFAEFVRDLSRNRLGIIVTLVAPGSHGQIPEDQLDGLTGARFGRYAALVERFARELESWKLPALALEPMNEPQQACAKPSGPDWTDYQDVLLRRMRAAAGSLWLGVTGGCWSQIQGLEKLTGERLRDSRAFLSIHFYDPFLFTHQGADWTLPIMPLISGLPYPAREGAADNVLGRMPGLKLSPKDEARRPQLTQQATDAVRNYFHEDWRADVLAAKLDSLQAWCARNSVPADRVVFTEFGAMKTAGGGVSRRRWLHDVSSAVASRGWGWTLWLLKQGPFGLDDTGGRYDPSLLEAIGVGPL